MRAAADSEEEPVQAGDSQEEPVRGSRPLRRSRRLNTTATSTAASGCVAPLVPADGNDLPDAVSPGGDGSVFASSSSAQVDLQAAREHGPLTERAVLHHHEQELRELKSKVIRPLRTTRIGHSQQRTVNDDDFIREAINRDIFAVYVDNPKREGTDSYGRYKAYCLARTLGESITLSINIRPKGMSKSDARQKAMDDIHWDYEHGYILFPGNESLLEGHFVDARQLARDHHTVCCAETVPHLSLIHI